MKWFLFASVVQETVSQAPLCSDPKYVILTHRGWVKFLIYQSTLFFVKHRRNEL